MTLGGSFDTFRDNDGAPPTRFQRSGYLLGQPLKSLDPGLHLGPELPRLHQRKGPSFLKPGRIGVKRESSDPDGTYETTKKEVTKAAKRLKDDKGGGTGRIAVYFVSWWGLNIIFNVYNKKVLNVYPFPWLTSVMALFAGTVIMLGSWMTGCIQAPDTDMQFWQNLFPVAVAHSIGHVAATISMARSAVAFTQIIKSAEPAFSVVLSRLFLGERYPLPVYLSLLPVVGGCCLSAVTELNFDMIGFLGANVSNVAFVFRNFFSKRGMSKKVSGLNYYGCLCIMSLAILTPFAIAIEGFHNWNVGWQTASRAIGPPFLWWVIAQSVFYHLYNQVSYMSLDQISPLTFSIGNTMKRVSVIAASIFIFKTPVQPVNLIGAAIAIFGTFLYSQVDKRLFAVNSLTVPFFCRQTSEN
ncbi:hypothetical protein SELMODRAFT_79231 [Selaginella moellendorffii]|uniref:Sugar phosphate transporter domain-containing protein n=1 Tax=Selaginella moellendorffii TaxID=88036 RepID=D8QUE7_SELML|nr:hypothetical protein SELMODRAFT_79231 [Selaginella moellendorffii]